MKKTVKDMKYGDVFLDDDGEDVFVKIAIGMGRDKPEIPNVLWLGPCHCKTYLNNPCPIGVTNWNTEYEVLYNMHKLRALLLTNK